MSMGPEVNLKKICIIADSEKNEKALLCSDFLGAPINPADLDKFFFKLHLDETGLWVQDAEKRKLQIDFDKNHLDYQRKGHRGKNELIARALGLGKGCSSVLDLSVGMAIDSIFLSQLGFGVTGIERSPLLFLLLRDAFKKSQKEELKNYQLHFADALQFLKSPPAQIKVDAIYFDPMYPHKKKSALPKQEMMVFRDLVGDDGDAAEVLREALKWPVQRVAVKRPLHAPELLPGVRHSFEGKVVRYDTYMVG